MVRDLNQNDSANEDVFKIIRKTFNYIQFHKFYPEKPFIRFPIRKLVMQFFKKNFQISFKCFKLNILKRLPFIGVINNYKKEYFLVDFITGIEVNNLIFFFQ